MNESDRRYLELLKLALIDALNPTTLTAISLGTGEVRIEELPPERWSDRMNGEDWPVNAVTMVGYARLTNIERCLETVVAENIPGDFIETGVWRGGASMYAAAVLDVLGDTKRRVWLADSYQGLPEGDGVRYPADANDLHHKVRYMACPLIEVEENFDRFGISTDRVTFLEGWFRDTLPTLADEWWSVVRLDGDMYESSILGFECLYPRLSPGGFCIVDDYGVPGCHRATDDYRAKHGINVESPEIGESESIYWRKP